MTMACTGSETKYMVNFKVLLQDSSIESEEKPQISLVGVPTDIWTRYLPNTNKEHYDFIQVAY
jgi:hypothetical protein